MAVLDILQFPDPRLRTKAKPVETVDDALRALIDDMYETMYDANGVGLAATQVDIHQRIFTMDISDTHDQPSVVLNPELVNFEGEQYEGEGCLSVSGAFEKVKRALKVTMRGVDLDFNPIEIEAEGLLAVVFQHEIDHLNGVLFVDHLSKLKRNRIRTKIEKAKR